MEQLALQTTGINQEFASVRSQLDTEIGAINQTVRTEGLTFQDTVTACVTEASTRQIGAMESAWSQLRTQLEHRAQQMAQDLAGRD